MMEEPMPPNELEAGKHLPDYIHGRRIDEQARLIEQLGSRLSEAEGQISRLKRKSLFALAGVAFFVCLSIGVSWLLSA